MKDKRPFKNGRREILEAYGEIKERNMSASGEEKLTREQARNVPYPRE
jgi:hypothetical protein